MPSTTIWRDQGPFAASSALFTGILDESRLFLQTYAQQSGNVEERVAATSRLLVEGVLPQRSRASRVSIVRRLHTRLTNGSPPAWVMDDLARFAQEPDPASLKAALLLHVCRRDSLLYAIAQDLIVRMWESGRLSVHSADVHRFLAERAVEHPEIETWSRQTRERLGTTTLSIFRDYGLLHGKANKKIVEPVVPDEVALHLVQLLRAEGIHEADIPHHPDWRLWLWSTERAQRFLAEQSIA